MALHHTCVWHDSWPACDTWLVIYDDSWPACVTHRFRRFIYSTAHRYNKREMALRHPVEVMCSHFFPFFPSSITCFWHLFNSYFSFIHLFLPKFSFSVLFMNTKFYVKNTKRLFVEGISLILIFVISLHFSWPPLYSYFPFIYLLHSPSLLKKQVHLGVTHAGHESSKKK